MPKLLLNISKQSSQHQPILFRLAVTGLEALNQSSSQRDFGAEEEFAAKYPFLQDPADQENFLNFATKAMLYQPAALLPRVAAPVSQGFGGVQVPRPLLQHEYQQVVSIAAFDLRSTSHIFPS